MLYVHVNPSAEMHEWICQVWLVPLQCWAVLILSGKPAGVMPEKEAQGEQRCPNVPSYKLQNEN